MTYFGGATSIGTVSPQTTTQLVNRLSVLLRICPSALVSQVARIRPVTTLPFVQRILEPRVLLPEARFGGIPRGQLVGDPPEERVHVVFG
jgi:hypothetical protein